MKRAKYRASGSCLAASHRVYGSEDRQCQAELAILGQRVGIDYARATFVLASSFLKTADLTRSPCPLDAGGSRMVARFAPREAMMTTVGYARVSSLGQDLTVQLE